MKNTKVLKERIESRVKKLFNCEAMSCGIIVEISESLAEGKLPEFSDVECCCESKSAVMTCCKYGGSQIFEVLQLSGVIELCNEYLEHSGYKG